jgi:hypothetical protein
MGGQLAADLAISGWSNASKPWALYSLSFGNQQPLLLINLHYL